MTEPTEITLRLPDKNVPGFLKRIREVQAILQESKGFPELWENLASYVIDHGYVETPAGVDPHEAIGELSLADLQRIASILMGNPPDDAPPAVDPTKEGN